MKDLLLLFLDINTQNLHRTVELLELQGLEPRDNVTARVFLRLREVQTHQCVCVCVFSSVATSLE